jgi:tetratricopeptide (TPR) repeat protein
MNFKILLFTTLLISFSSFSQEKRLALVIGNSNYEKGPLKNPVNDALLMAKNLKALNFDIILDTNIETIIQFNDVVRKFGDLRDQYNVGLIYYAGHGIQINDVNYLLATKEEYLSEFDVEDKALSVQKIMRYLTDRTDEVNVLILDACRNNPFEKNWTTVSRSGEVSKGLAKLSPPTGSLIAYSTDAGNTASDGDQKNSIYCLSLTKNMNIEDISLDQVFRNVRREVLTSSDGKQRPVEASQLTGTAFYLKKSTYTDKIKEIDSLIEINNFDIAREKTTAILTLDPTNKQALLRKGRIEYNTLGSKYDGKELFKASELYKKDQEVYEYISRYYSVIGKNEQAIEEINKAIQIDPNYAEYFYWRARFQSELKNNSEAITDFTKAIELEPTNANRYIARATFYNEELNKIDSSLIDFSKAISLNPEDTASLYIRGSIYYQLNQISKALEDFNQILKINPSDVSARNFMGLIYKDQGKLDLALFEFEKGIAYENNDPENATYCYMNRAEIYIIQKKYSEALNDYNNSILLTPKNADAYNYRGLFYMDYFQDYNNALLDFSKAIELDMNSIEFLYNRGLLFSEYLNNYEKALENFQKILIIDPGDIDALNYIGLIYLQKGDINQAIDQYEKGIALEKTNPESASFCYRNRAEIYAKQGKFNEALIDYTKAIELNSLNPDKYQDRAFFFKNYLQNYNSALTDFSKSIEIQPKNTDYLYNRGVLYCEFLNLPNLALKDFEQILKVDSNYIDAITYIGLIYLDQGDTNLAISQYEKGINLETITPESAAFCYINRASVYSEQGNLEAALKDFTKAIELYPGNSDFFNLRGDFYIEKLNKKYDALVDYSMALSIDSQSIYQWHKRGVFLSTELNDQLSAISDFEQILKIDSNNVTAMNWIGVFYARLHNEKKEKEYYLKTIAKENYAFEDSLDMHINGISFAYQNLGEMMQTSEDKTIALNYFNQAIVYDPYNPEKYFLRGWFLGIYLKKYEESIKDINKSIEFDKDNPKWYIKRAKIYLLQGDQKKAGKDFNQAVKLSNENAFYIAERGNYLSTINEYNTAEKDLYEALNKDSTIRCVYHYITENLIRQNKQSQAINFATATRDRFENDTVSFEQLGRIYLEKKDLIKSLKAYQTAATIMDFNLEYKTIEPGTNHIFSSDIYIKIAGIYSQLNEISLQCESFQYALKTLKNETRPDKLELEKIIIDNIISKCN